MMNCLLAFLSDFTGPSLAGKLLQGHQASGLGRLGGFIDHNLHSHQALRPCGPDDVEAALQQGIAAAADERGANHVGRCDELVTHLQRLTWMGSLEELSTLKTVSFGGTMAQRHNQ